MPARHKFTTRPSSTVGFELGQQMFFVWKCPNCTWIRMRTNREWWERQMIQHGYYGRINNFELFHREVADHKCEMTAAARIKIGIDPASDPLEKYRRTYEDDRS